MSRIYRLILLLSVAALLLAGCSEKNNDSFVPVGDLTVSPDFNWQANRQVAVNLEVLTTASAPVPGVVFELYTDTPENFSTPISKGSTDASGKMQTNLNLPTYITKVWAVGFMSTVEIPIVNNEASYTFGGSVAQIKGGTASTPPSSKNWLYPAGWTFTSQGLPSPRTNTPLEADFLTRINATLPERKSVPQYHPHYLNSMNQTNLKIDEQAEVWVTFVHEGAGNKNSMGFHTFPSGNVPTSTSQVGPRTIILPNASMVGSSGALTPGDTFYLGVFDPGTTVGWFLVANGWQSGSNVSTTAPVYYSTPGLNPEATADKKQHSILVYDNVSERLIIGFEDLPRVGTASDDDFNDLVYFITINPITAVDLDDVPPMDVPDDRDNDGISDLFDDYPDDPELAFNNYTYGPGTWGTLAFEDLWPDEGDYDFNDMVVDYNYNQITKAGNLVKKVEMNFRLRAVGASFRNGFAVQTPFNNGNLYNVQSTHPALFEHETDGTKAVLRFFNNSFDLIPQQPGGFINTQPDRPFITPVEFGASFWLTTPAQIVNIAPVPPYNPFIFVNTVRSHEIHLPGFAPTSRMNNALFGTGDDASTAGNWYKTANNLPWAVNIPESWDYPVEKAQTTRAYLKFKNWAQSSGTQYPDWFRNLPGYRDNSYIYQVPNP